MLVATCIAAICVLVGVVYRQYRTIMVLRTAPKPPSEQAPPPPLPLSLNDLPPPDGTYVALRSQRKIQSFRKLKGERPEMIEKAHGYDLPSRYDYAETVGNIHYYEERL